MIHVHQVNFGYIEHVEILKDITFHVKRGENVGIIGFNGSGKTTLIHLLTGILKPQKGSISVLGMSPNINDPIFKKEMGIAFDETNLIDFLTVREYLEFSCAVYDQYKKVNIENIRYFLHYLNLETYENVLIKELSFGTKKKVQFISCFISRPALLLLDEPTNSLDFETIIKIEKLIRETTAEQSIIIASHDFSFLEQTCDTYYILKNGQLFQLNSSRDAFSLRTEVISFLKGDEEDEKL